jgi:2,3-bisphosphoglycerate-independent phosphoglycerate mutase
MWLGMDPREVSMAQGPLTVAALGFDPPERSAHYHLSLMSLIDGTIHQLTHLVSADIADHVLELAKRLNTSRLTVLPGDGADHAMVLEDGSIDVGLHTPNLAAGKGYQEALPEGDDEALLRRFIDDSVNLLHETEFNLRRIEEGLEPINLIWPWGVGFRQSVPNLVLRTGLTVHVQSRSMRLAGLTRLAQWKHGDRRGFGRGTNIRLETIAKDVLSKPTSIVFIEEFAEFRSRNMLEEGNWLTHELSHRLLEPIADAMDTDEIELTLLSPSEFGSGLTLRAGFDRKSGNGVPFHEKVIDDGRLPMRQTWEVVRAGVLGS